jgi:hypothetical protein
METFRQPKLEQVGCSNPPAPEGLQKSLNLCLDSDITASSSDSIVARLAIIITSNVCLIDLKPDCLASGNELRYHWAIFTQCFAESQVSVLQKLVCAKTNFYKYEESGD